MDLTLTQYGDYEVTLGNGAVLRLKEARAGRLEIRAREGGLVIHPRSANLVEVGAVDWDGVEAKA